MFCHFFNSFIHFIILTLQIINERIAVEVPSSHPPTGQETQFSEAKIRSYRQGSP
jgi:hypothetical protein